MYSRIRPAKLAHELAGSEIKQIHINNFFTVSLFPVPVPILLRCVVMHASQRNFPCYGSDNRSHGDRNQNAIDVWVIGIKETAVHHRPTCAESIEPGYEEQVVREIV